MQMKSFRVLCATALLTAAAAGAAEPPGPTREGMRTWKHDVLAKYKQVIYLDAEYKPIDENAFVDGVVTARRAFTMQVDPADPTRITIRLLNASEARAAQAGGK